ncbi:hypothetical protein RSOLAG22IIIB_10736 [Rhizoctonia solani]|uniref:Uncharacterized protein n=1 Tax=Rhizoctonia solani TaxID=456999 RepID=A0A0K6G554_9AGAM|nr:hypothetical protein RSOLAG22IIIB_10736 [Rhizoctonia solani]
MDYEGADNILSLDGIGGLARQGMYPAEPRESSEMRADSPTEHPEMDFTEEDLARIDKAGDLDVNAPAPTPSPPLPFVGPLTYSDTLREAAKKKLGSTHAHGRSLLLGQCTMEPVMHS